LGEETNKIIIGTSGFSYPDWQGVFYPSGLPREEWLAFYSRHFSFCELNFSYYRMPRPENLEKYLQHPIKFAIKAHGSMTHERLESKLPRQDFLEAARVLQQDDHLVAVLLQFPYAFSYRPDNRKYLLDLLTDLAPLPLVVEFRHPAWIRDSVFAELKRHGWGMVNLDSPQVSGGMPDYLAVTAPLAYLRFHGRNAENWWQGNNISRYDYEYSREELESWLPRIRSMAEQARTTYIAFNNHARGQAIKNANQLTEILSAEALI